MPEAIPPQEYGDSPAYRSLRSWYLLNVYCRSGSGAQGIGPDTAQKQFPAYAPDTALKDSSAYAPNTAQKDFSADGPDLVNEFAQQLALANRLSHRLKVPAAQPPAKLSWSNLRVVLALVPLLAQIPIALLLLATCWPNPVDNRVLLGLLLAGIAGSLGVSAVFMTTVSRRLKSIAKKLAEYSRGYSDKNKQDPLTAVEQLTGSLLNSLVQAVKREQLLADCAMNFICALNKDNRVSAASPTFLGFVGFDRTELLGRKFVDIAAAADRKRTLAFLSAIQDEKGIVSFENKIKRKDGSLIDVAWQMEWSMAEETLFCSGRDVSALKLIENMRTEFMTLIGRDLRSPLAAISCTQELIAGNAFGELSEKGQTMLVEAKSETDRMLQIIGLLLDLEGLETGTLAVKREPVQLIGLLRDAADSVKSLASTRELDVVTPPSSNEISVSGDHERLTQVMAILMANAIKTSPRGGDIEITVTAEGGFALTSINDQGPGITDDVREKVFARFRKSDEGDREVDDSTKFRQRLEMCLTKTIVDAHGGSIGVTSELGTGSTFWLKLPLA